MSLLGWRKKRKSGAIASHFALTTVAFAAKLIAALFCVIPTVSIAATFQGLGFLRGYDYSEVAGISSDGKTVTGNLRPVGGEASASPSSQPFIWTSAAGMTGLGYLPGQNYGYALGISGDGSTVVGWGEALYSISSAFKWTAPTGMVSLGTGQLAFAANASGSAVFGRFDRTAGRWTAAAGWVGLGFPTGYNTSTARGVSSDGSVVVGYAINTLNNNMQGFRWTAQTGMVALGLLPWAAYGYAFATNADGSVVVGFNATNNFGAANNIEAFRWTASTGVIGLGRLPGDNFSQAYAVSADGSVIVGFNGPNAFIWTPTYGMKSIQDILIADGLNLNGWSLSSAIGISADGTVIVGNGIDPSGHTEAWIANLAPTATPLPAALPLFASGLGVIGLIALRRKRRAEPKKISADPEKSPNRGLGIVLSHFTTKPGERGLCARL